MPRTFETAVAGLAGDGRVRKGGVAYRGKSEWRSLDPKRYCNPDERGDTRVGIVDRRRRSGSSGIHTCDREKRFLLRVANGLRHVFLLSGIEKHHRGRGGDPEAKSYVFVFIFIFFLQGVFLFILAYFPFFRHCSPGLPLCYWGLVSGYFLPFSRLGCCCSHVPIIRLSSIKIEWERRTKKGWLQKSRKGQL